MRQNLGSAFAALVLLLSLSSLAWLAFASTAQNNVTASVSVICPFALKYNVLPTYTRGTNVVMNYSVWTPSQCTINGLSGKFILKYKPTGNTVLAQNEVVNSVTQVSGNTLYYITVSNTLPMQLGNYTANLTFNNFMYTNSSVKTYDLIAPANVQVSNFTSAPSGTVTQNAAITFHSTLFDNGSLAATNVIVYINITGPSNTLITQSVPSMSPLTYQYMAISSGSVTGTSGTYTAKEYATFVSNTVVETSNNVTLQYTVVAPSPSSPPSSSGPPPSTPPVVPVPGLSITTVPLLMVLVSGQQYAAYLGLQNTATNTEVINVSVPSDYSNLLQLSTNSLSLPSGQAANIGLLFSSAGVPAGTYIIPLTVSAGISGAKPASQTEYLTFTVMMPSSASSPTLTNEFTLTNSTTAATGIITIRSPSNASLDNATASLFVPLDAVANGGHIIAYGLPSKVVSVQGGFMLYWTVPYLPPGQVVYAYYSISKVLSQVTLMQARTSMVLQSAPAAQSILKVVNIELPTFYTNTTNEIDVYSLYTGTAQQPVSFILSGPSDLTVYNSAQTTNATPNQLLFTKFLIGPVPMSETLLFTLYVATGGANYSYSLPVLVVPRQLFSATTISPAPAFPLGTANLVEIGGTVLFLILVILSLIAIRRSLGKPHYDKDRAEHLVRMREQIRRSGGNE